MIYHNKHVKLTLGTRTNTVTKTNIISINQVIWEVPMDAIPGTYRLGHRGFHKSLTRYLTHFFMPYHTRPSLTLTPVIPPLLAQNFTPGLLHCPSFADLSWILSILSLDHNHSILFISGVSNHMRDGAKPFKWCRHTTLLELSKHVQCLNLTNIKSCLCFLFLNHKLR